MLLDLENIQEQLKLATAQVKDPVSLESFRREWIGKQGKIKLLFKNLSKLSEDQKVTAATQLNQIKDRAEDFILKKTRAFELIELEQQIASEYLDLSISTKTFGSGAIHPIRLVEDRITEILKPFGFAVVEGPEIETDYFCFDSLNIPKHHPARDLQDTFYTEDGFVLRTHTTSVQARQLSAAEGKAPVKIISCGRVYRNETEDPSHQAMFHQYELVWIEAGLTLSNLMALLNLVLKSLYGSERKVRFVPKFYPYTEPSIGAQIDCSICKSTGCSACGDSGWVTIVGAGMVHHKVLEEFGYNPKTISGLAFGFGTSRLAAQFYNAPNLKALYEGDLRYLGALR